jgi:hypothetical protein
MPKVLKSTDIEVLLEGADLGLREAVLRDGRVEIETSDGVIVVTRENIEEIDRRRRMKASDVAYAVALIGLTVLFLLL